MCARPTRGCLVLEQQAGLAGALLMVARVLGQGTVGQVGIVHSLPHMRGLERKASIKTINEAGAWAPPASRSAFCGC